MASHEKYERLRMQLFFIHTLTSFVINSFEKKIQEIFTCCAYVILFLPFVVDHLCIRIDKTQNNSNSENSKHDWIVYSTFWPNCNHLQEWIKLLHTIGVCTIKKFGSMIEISFQYCKWFLNNNNDQWSDLLIISQLLKRKSDKLHVMLLSFGVEFHRVWIWLKSAHDEMWLRTSELSFKRRSVFPSNVFCIATWTSKLVNNRTSVLCWS